MAKNLKVAFVGAGNMTREHMKAFQAQGDTTLAGITNRTIEKAQTLADAFAVGTVCKDIASLYEVTKADIVVMAVYEPAILETIMELMKYPWVILMEKPMGMNLVQAQKIAEAARQNNAKLHVGLNRRTMAASRAALDDLDNQPGKRFVHVQDQQNLETARKIGHAEDVVQNWMFANSVHLVDYLSCFGRGAVTSVSVLERWTPDAPERVVAHITFEHGDTAIYEAHWNSPGPWACTITTPQRRWDLRPLEKAQFQNAGERVLNRVEDDPIDSDFKAGFYHQAAKICAIARDEPDVDAATFEDALKTMELVSTIYAQN